MLMYAIEVKSIRFGQHHQDFCIPPEDPLFVGFLTRLEKPVEVGLTTIRYEENYFLVQGEVLAQATLECRRCLKPSPRRITATFIVSYAIKATPESRADAVEVDEYVELLPSTPEVDIGEKVREVLLLEVPTYPLCRDDCPGMCPQCGKNLNEGACGCEVEEQDPRWSKLVELKEKLFS